MIERVCAAIRFYVQAFNYADNSRPSYYIVDDVAPEHLEGPLERDIALTKVKELNARAALAAMRAPTTAMIDAGSDLLDAS